MSPPATRYSVGAALAASVVGVALAVGVAIAIRPSPTGATAPGDDARARDLALGAPASTDGAGPALDAPPSTDGAAPSPIGPLASADAAAFTAPDPVAARAPDLSARIATARSLLGPHVRVEIAGDLFVLVDCGAGALFDASLTLARRALAVLLDGRLAVLPDEAVTAWIVGSPERYAALLKSRVPDAGWESPLGLYHAATREIFVDASPGVSTLTHELMHPLLQADFPRAPTWLVEGFASLYEGPDLSEAGEIHGIANYRREVLLAALRAPPPSDPPRLDALFAMDTPTFRARANERQHYAMAREALRWLDARGVLWSFYAAWRDGVLDDPRGERAFARVVGMSPADANDAWIAWERGAGAHR